MQTVDVIGGGFSGLIQAFYLQEAGLSVRLIEKQSRLGGLIGSRETHGFINETAANAILANREIERIAKVINLSLAPANKTSAKRFIFRDSKLRRFPLSVGVLGKPLLFLLRRMFQGGIPSTRDNETLRQWGDRTLGVQVSDYLLEPAMQGVFACGIDQLDAQLVLSSIFSPRERGRLKGSVAPAGGMQQWIDHLQRYLEKNGCEVVTAQEWSGGSRSVAKVFAVGLSDLKGLAASGVVSLPSSLQSTTSASLTSVKLMFMDSTPMPLGFGSLFPRPENFNSLGVLYNHGIFNGRVPKGAESETWILNDSIREVSHMDKASVIQLVLSDRKRLVPSSSTPEFTEVDQWSKKIPVYNIQLRTFLEDLDKSDTCDYFVGNYLGHLGLGKIIFRARENAKKIRSIVHG